MPYQQDQQPTFTRESDQWGERLNLIWEVNGVRVEAEWVDFDRFRGNFNLSGRIYGQYNLAQVAFILEFFRQNPQYVGNIDEKLKEAGL